VIREVTHEYMTQLSHYDVCIVGCGPAGLTVCAELIDSGRRICLIESGGFDKSSFGDGLRHVVQTGLKLDDESQERRFGGTSETWSGLCAPLDPIDFARRSFSHHIGWPINNEDLRPYYERAVRYGFPAAELFDRSRMVLHGSTPTPPPPWESCEEKLFLKPSPIYRFGSELRQTISRANNVDLFINATVIQLTAVRGDQRGRARVQWVICRTPDGKELRIGAEIFVVATGAIETPRLLLNSRGSDGGPLGNEHDQVGRYLMNHPKGRSGTVRLSKPLPLSRCFSWKSYDEGTGFVGVRLRDKVQARDGWLNSYATVAAHYPWSNRREPEAFRAVLAELKAVVPLFLGWRRRDTTRLELSRKYMADLRSLRSRWRPLAAAIVHALLCLPVAIWLSALRLMRGRSGEVETLSFMNYAEMEPNPDNRVTLSDQVDAFGMPLPHVTHRLSRRDVDSILALQQSVARELALQGYNGTLETSRETLASEICGDACHYLGTTRMGDDPSSSVVNADQRVHSVDNLYISGGAVFPSSGCANPTMTIVALAIRLADHLRDRAYESDASEQVAASGVNR
jgi:choline dehydrogenase-like flavoprotein